MTKTVKVVASVVGGATALAIGILGFYMWKRPTPKYDVGYSFKSGGCPAKVTSRSYDGVEWNYEYTYTCSSGSGDGSASESDMSRMAGALSGADVQVMQ